VKKYHSELPLYMQKINEINEQLPFPSIVSHKIYNDNIILSIHIPEKDNNNNTVHVYCGDKDGLTIADMWKKEYKKKNIKNGESKITISSLYKYYRILVKDSNMQIWNLKTYHNE
jgi:hypothetical protein